MVTNPQAQTINAKNISGKDGWDEAVGRTGFIPCENGFTAEVKLLVSYYLNSWSGIIIYLVTDQITTGGRWDN